MLTACGNGGNDEVAETEQVTTVSEVATATETTETTVETTTETVAEENASPAVYSADEKYEYYPLEIIYPEKQETDITAETVEIAEDLCNADGYCIEKFEASYPVFSSESVDSAVLDKINQQIRAYIDEAYEYERTCAEEYTDYDEIEFTEEPYASFGFVNERQIKCDIDYSDSISFDVSGNILSVDFVDYNYPAGTPHGYPLPVPTMFDLRTGEQIKLSEMVSDKMAFSERFMASITDVMFKTRLEYESNVMADYNDVFTEIMDTDPGEAYGVDADGNIIIGYCNADTRLTVKNGCVGFYLAPYEYGTYADGIRLAEVPVDTLLMYMTDEGAALFEGIASAAVEPVLLTVDEDGTEKIVSREQAE